VVWGRVIHAGGNSFFAKMDNGADLVWDTGTSHTWAWTTLGNRGQTATMRFSLTAGTHTLWLKEREAGTKLDRLLITNDLTSTPQ
jgi:hypothetical protein